jgi:hypothetical protein
LGRIRSIRIDTISKFQTLEGGWGRAEPGCFPPPLWHRRRPYRSIGCFRDAPVVRGERRFKAPLPPPPLPRLGWLGQSWAELFPATAWHRRRPYRSIGRFRDAPVVRGERRFKAPLPPPPLHIMHAYLSGPPSYHSLPSDSSQPAPLFVCRCRMRSALSKQSFGARRRDSSWYKFGSD